MTWGTIQVGRLTLSERPGGQLDDVVHATTLVRTAAFEGQESAPPLTFPELHARQEDLIGLMGRIVPVRFTEKPNLNGYYEIVDTNTGVAHFGGEVAAFGWQIRAERRGHDREVDLESQLSGPPTRTNVWGLTGERWHAPPPQAYAYALRTGTPSTLTVTGAEGPLTVYRQLPTDPGVNPRWGCPVDGYGGYRARVHDSDGIERTGLEARLPPTGWHLTNGLVRVRCADDGNGLLVASHDGARWVNKLWRATAPAGMLGAPTQTTIVRNDYECVTLRLTWSSSPGRSVLDLTLRRGARWVQGYLQVRPSGSCGVALAAPESTSAPPGAGYITAAADDADGRRFYAGSAGTFTANTGASSITRASTAVFDFIVGATIGAGAAGDTATNHMARYLGSTAEVTKAVRR